MAKDPASVGRDKRSQYAEQADKRIVRKGSAIVKSINKEIDYRILATIGSRPKGSDEAEIWRGRAAGIRLQFWKDAIRSKRFGRDGAKLREFTRALSEAMHDPQFKRDLVKAAEYATAKVYAAAYDLPIAVSARGRSTSKTIFKAPARESGESAEGYDARVAMARIRHYGGNVALPDISPIDFNDIYMKRPPQRSSFQFTLNDPRVRQLIAGGLSPSEAIRELGDFAYAASKSQFAEVQKLHRIEPLHILVDDPESIPPPNRDDFGYEAGSGSNYSAALREWFDARHKAKTATQWYVCGACSSAVHTGHKCRCSLDTKSGQVHKATRYPVNFHAPKLPPFKAPPLLAGEPDEVYAARVKRAKDEYDRYSIRQLNAAFEKHQQAKAEYLVPFELRNTFRQLPGHARLIASIDAKVLKSLGPVPSRREPEKLAAYNLERSKRVAAEFQREVQDRIASTKQEDLRILSPKALKAATRKDGSVSARGLVRAMAREETESLAEKLSTPGTALVSATSKTEAEAKATNLFRGGETSSERRLEQLRRKIGRGEVLSFKERRDYDRLSKSGSLVIEHKVPPTGLKGFAGFMDDFGGNVTALTLTGLAAFAIFRAITARSAQRA